MTGKYPVRTGIYPGVLKPGTSFSYFLFFTLGLF